ncbi:peptide chain release factor N(5)-glutamine methyltransferase [Pelagibacterales bacterium SAG-MED11]|nr:peptide chain release factor N(5)-glutamine methyltransferase [Pelagibacterales bacterium SAG-MED11]
MNIQTAVQKAQLFLKKKNIKSPVLDSQILMSEAIKKEKEFIIFNFDKEISNKNLEYFNKLILQRARGEPIAYLVKKKYFWKYQFSVNRDVLIPRPDTEVLIEEVLKLTKNKDNLNLLDVGVGSGCILISILKDKKNFYGTGIDISKKSLDTCKINGENLGVINRLKLYKSDIDNFHFRKYDLIISNPPYIKKSKLKYLEKDVIGYEPKQALDGGMEGLSEISKVINRSSELIKKNGFLILEIGFDQKWKVKKILENKGFYIKKIVRDLSNNDRCIVSKKI